MRSKSCSGVRYGFERSRPDCGRPGVRFLCVEGEYQPLNGATCVAVSPYYYGYGAHFRARWYLDVSFGERPKCQNLSETTRLRPCCVADESAMKRVHLPRLLQQAGGRFEQEYCAIQGYMRRCNRAIAFARAT